MKVLPLGIQDAFPVPLFHGCMDSGPSFVIFLDNGKKILFDAPPGINKVLRYHEINPLDIDALCVTHPHNDHIGGILEFLQFRTLAFNDSATWIKGGYFPKNKTQFFKLSLFSPSMEFVEWFDLDLVELLRLNGASNFMDYVHTYTNAKEFSEDVGIKVSIKKGKHAPDSYAFKFGRLGISGDTEYDEKLVRWLSHETSKVFHEMGYGKGHTTIEDARKIMKQINNVSFYHIPYGVLRNHETIEGMPVVSTYLQTIV